ncbi:MAG: hypothetical protein ACYDH5_20190 [Acidimicrobiales bacterium]
MVAAVGNTLGAPRKIDEAKEARSRLKRASRAGLVEIVSPACKTKNA